MLELINVEDKHTKKEFLELPKKLYKEDLKQDKKVEKKLIDGNYILSKYFKFYPFILVKDGQTVGRCAITIYKDKLPEGYIGFFECIDDVECAKYMLSSVEKFAKMKGIKNLIGPVDASFWIKYRFKINLFEGKSYSGEPYNKEYYYKLFTEAGYKIKYHYSSNIFPKLTKEMQDEKLTKRLENMKSKGYEIKNASFIHFNKQIKEIYKELIVLYSDFPMFSHITEKEFFKLYKNLKYILNYKMVKLGYKNNKLVAFFICIPNYGEVKSLKQILKIRKHPKEYVLMYLGSNRKDRGMGAALVQCIEEELYKEQARAIGALIIDEKISGKYYQKIVTNKYEYILMEKII